MSTHNMTFSLAMLSALADCSMGDFRDDTRMRSDREDRALEFLEYAKLVRPTSSGGFLPTEEGERHLEALCRLPVSDGTAAPQGAVDVNDLLETIEKAWASCIQAKLTIYDVNALYVLSKAAEIVRSFKEEVK